MQDYGLEAIYLPGFPGLWEAFYVQDALMDRYLPRLKSHLVCPFRCKPHPAPTQSVARNNSILRHRFTQQSGT